MYNESHIKIKKTFIKKRIDQKSFYIFYISYRSDTTQIQIKQITN